MTTLYGIKQCDTVKKAFKWLDSHQAEYTFHDLRKDGLDEAMIQRWIDALGWETLVNKRSTTWRNLDNGVKEGLNEQSVTAVLLENPTLIKRPILENGTTTLIGFKEESYKKALGC